MSVPVFYEPESRSMEASPYVRGMERLVFVVQELSLARDLPSLMNIVKRAARELTGADGATFILRDGPFCYYAAEDAIGPLWKGKRFSLETCVSGWSMLNRRAAIIEDIYMDPRVPTDAYAPTFVKSLVMVPIRTASPVGAIGIYWARKRLATPEEVKLLAALADSTSVAMENVQLYQTLEWQVQERTKELVASREELAVKHAALLQVQRQKEEMAAHLVHDLKSPASGIMLSCKCRLRSAGLSDADRQRWKRIYVGAEEINRMALNLLDITQSEDGSFTPHPGDMDLQGLLEEVVEMMTPLAEGCEQRLELKMELGRTTIRADEELLRRVLQNLTDNALRYNPPGGTVQLLVRQGTAGTVELCVLDEGPGIPAEMRQAIFDKYKRLAPGSDARSTCGHGLGLTFCRLVVQGHGGSIAVEANHPRGSAFIVRLPSGDVVQ